MVANCFCLKKICDSFLRLDFLRLRLFFTLNFCSPKKWHSKLGAILKLLYIPLWFFWEPKTYSCSVRCPRRARLEQFEAHLPICWTRTRGPLEETTKFGWKGMIEKPCFFKHAFSTMNKTMFDKINKQRTDLHHHACAHQEETRPLPFVIEKHVSKLQP